MTPKLREKIEKIFLKSYNILDEKRIDLIREKKDLVNKLANASETTRPNNGRRNHLVYYKTDKNRITSWPDMIH